jgi:hypothetical protein
MNDPFDVYIDDIFDFELKNWYIDTNANPIDMLSSSPVEFARRTGVSLDAAIEASTTLNAGTVAQRHELLAFLASPFVGKIYPHSIKERELLETHKLAIIDQFRNTGIFCATRSRSNLLMWSHYAEQHRGVVFGFQPDSARDSFLCLLEPVAYSDVRPSFRKLADPMMEEEAAPTLEALRAFSRSLTAVKSTHWAYEEELRLVVPSYVPEGQSAVFMPYHATELAELYLGLRMSASDRNELSAAARTVNKNVAVFQARMTPGAYSLSFERV